MILCLPVTIDIVWKMGSGNLHVLFRRVLETCLVGVGGAVLMGDDSRLFKLTLVI